MCVYEHAVGGGGLGPDHLPIPHDQLTVQRQPRPISLLQPQPWLHNSDNHLPSPSYNHNHGYTTKATTFHHPPTKPQPRLHNPHNHLQSPSYVTTLAESIRQPHSILLLHNHTYNHTHCLDNHIPSASYLTIMRNIYLYNHVLLKYAYILQRTQ